MVSVIIPKRRGENIYNCLYSVRASAYKDIEIIVVDEGLERSVQRNIGIDRSKGYYLLILDSDMEIHPHLIAECVWIMRYQCDAIYIPEIITTRGWFGRLRNWERQFYTGTAVDVVRFVLAPGCPRFDENMSGPEDSDWDRRIEGIRRIANYPIYHNDKVGIIKFLNKKAYYTKSMGRFKKKWPNDKVLQFRYRCIKIFTENGKWKRLLRQPHLALAVGLLLFMRGLIYQCVRKS